MTEQEYCQFALSIQDASNLSGLVMSWSEALTKATFFTSTKQRNEHPATVLIISKLYDLSGSSQYTMSEEWDYCKEMTGRF